MAHFRSSRISEFGNSGFLKSLPARGRDRRDKLRGSSSYRRIEIALDHNDRKKNKTTTNIYNTTYKIKQKQLFSDYLVTI